MEIDDTETEFFGSIGRRSRPRRSERARAKREERNRLRPLGSSDPDERSRAAVALAEQGLDGNAATLLEFVRGEADPDVRASVAHAVLTAPVSPDPDGPEAKLRDWGLAELRRQGGAAAVATAVPPEPAPFISGPAPVAPASPSSPSPPPSPPLSRPPSAPPIAPSPDDRWRSGMAPLVPARPARSGPPPPPPPPPAPPHPPVVGGTIGAPAPITAEPRTRKPPEPEPAPEPEPEPEPVNGGTPAPATWRIVKASPVDIVVWEPAEPSA